MATGFDPYNTMPFITMTNVSTATSVLSVFPAIEDFYDQDITKINPLIDYKIDQKTQLEKVLEYLGII